MTALPFLFGKLPAVGDFVTRGLLPAQRIAWDGRCTTAMLHAHEQFGAQFARLFESAPPCGFAFAPTSAEPLWQFGCVAPSCDRAGRSFLLVLGIATLEPWHSEAESVVGRIVPVLHATIGTLLDPGRVIDAIARALATDIAADGAEEIEVMTVWRDDWLTSTRQGADGQRTMS